MAKERDESIFSLREVTRVREIDYEIEQSLANNAPQALLRDLHRAVTNFGINPLEFAKHERIVDGGRGDVAEMKRTIFTDYRVPIMELNPARQMYSESIAERRKIMKAPWADAPKFGAQYLPSTMTTW